MLTSGGRKQLEYLEFGWRLSIVNIWISKANKGVSDHFIYFCIFFSSGAHERARCAWPRSVKDKVVC